MAVTASMVKELRERTGAGMMECKKALVETNGDLDAAAEHLRKSGLAQADKKASRIAAEGKLALAASADGKEIVMVEVNCETDFVAKDDSFLAFIDAVANNALNLGSTDVDALMATELNGGSVEHARQALVSKIGENVQVRRISRLHSDDNIGAYVHGGRIGALVELEGGDAELSHDVAMHVAAMNPEYIDVDNVPADVLEREKQFLISQAQDSGKPAEIIEKMVTGRMRKHLSAITLLGQDFVKDGDVTVAQLLKKHNASVKGMTRLAVGEGIEKRQENFADEVMQQVKGG
ncbi:MAG: elongation factor Ts [Gammaproteobacteria bacterium]|nr:elongation factor Ts [Gammaproteobacteria bacterium]NNK98125.1 elongation factor Ts [Xanthomonadales bacterium]